MGKFKVPSWLHTAPAGAGTPSDAEKKRQNRRSFTGFSQHVRTKQESPAITKTETIREDTKQEVSQLLALAKKITAEAEKLEAYLKDNDVPYPGFGVEAPEDFPNLPDQIQQSRQEIVFATRELGSLVRGPRESVRWGVWSVCDLS